MIKTAGETMSGLFEQLKLRHEEMKEKENYALMIYVKKIALLIYLKKNNRKIK